jgi:hypothetical protein
MDFNAHIAQVAVPRLGLLRQANGAYGKHEAELAIELYDQIAASTPSDQESAETSAAIDGLAGFREIVGLTAVGDEDGARRQLTLLANRDAGAPLTRLAAQFWDQYGMTGGVQAACAQLAPQIDTQAGAVLRTLESLGVEIKHDELCVVP